MSQTSALNLGGFKEEKWGFTRLAPESWKSAISQNVPQASALGGRVCKKVNLMFNSIAPESWKSEKG